MFSMARLNNKFSTLSNNKINVGTVYKLERPEEINLYAADVYDMLYKSYESIGGLKSYRSYKDFLRKRHILEIVLSNDNELLACASYRRIEDSYKMVAIGCIQDNLGKLAMQQIIQHNISELKLYYWAEVSGAIEHYFKKHNGFPMPNVLASEILQIDKDDIILSKNDMVHYDRAIGADGEMFTKMIFGIKSEEIFKKAIMEVENYSKFMKEVNTLKESTQIYTVKQAIYIIENIYRAHEEDGYNELIPSWHAALIKSLKTLRLVAHPNQTINDYIEYCEYLLDDMPVLKIYKL